jgi:hypothetical protein
MPRGLGESRPAKFLPPSYSFSAACSHTGEAGKNAKKLVLSGVLSPAHKVFRFWAKDIISIYKVNVNFSKIITVKRIIRNMLIPHMLI